MTDSQAMAQINGNNFTVRDLEESVSMGADSEDGFAQTTDYFVIQLSKTLDHEQKNELESHNLQILQSIGAQSYLVRYGGQDQGHDQETATPNPEKVKDLNDISCKQHISPYAANLKLGPGLESLKEDDKVEVEVVLHHETSQNARDVSNDIEKMIGSQAEKMSLHAEDTIIRLEAGKSTIDSISKMDSVSGIHEVYEMGPHNNMAREVIHADVIINKDAFLGDDEIIFVADLGFDKGNENDTHPAFEGRVDGITTFKTTNEITTKNDPCGHGTHVCGSVLGDGESQAWGGRIQGTAPKARLLVQCMGTESGKFPKHIETGFSDFLQRAYVHDNNSRVHTNSWGPLISEFSPRQPLYTTASAMIDRFVWDHNDMVVCLSAGNHGANRQPLAAQIGGQAAAKNCITVGACGTTRNNGSIDKIADYSSRGPTTDGRIKPDVVAPGTSILSACSRAREPDTSAADKLWRFATGTSMATPLVAGCVAVLRQVLRIDKIEPGAALLKAMLINGATILKNEEGKSIDRNIQGFGRVDLANSIIRTGHTPSRDFEQGKLRNFQGEKFTREFSLSKYMKGQKFPATLKATLVSLDFPGSDLQHHVSLEVKIGQGDQSRRRLGNMDDQENLDPESYDKKNNVQQVVWNDLTEDTTVSLEVCLRTALLHGCTHQPFALVWSVGEPTPLASSTGDSQVAK